MVKDIEMAMAHYDGDCSKPYCDLVWRSLREKLEREKALEALGREKLEGYIEQLESLRENSRDFARDPETDAIWFKDIEALDWVIDFIRKVTME